MLPNLKKSGSLPSGIHLATWKEFDNRFAINDHRQNLIARLLNGLEVLYFFGCHEIYIGGSFVTDKPEPNDIDVCYNNTFMDLNKLKTSYPEFFDSKRGFYKQKKKFGCEFYPFNNFDLYIVEYFAFSRSGEPKGLVKIYLKDIFDDKERKTI